MDILFLIAAFIAVVISMQYIVGPIVVYKSQRIPQRYRFERLESDNFLADRSDIYKSLHEEIVENGFRYAGSSSIRDDKSETCFSIYYSDERQLTCILITASAVNIGATTQIEFTQMFEDGTLLSVSNNNMLTLYPKWEIKEGYRFPDINDFTELLSAAESIIGAKQGGRIKKPMLKGLEFETIENHLNEEVEHLLKLGWLAPDPIGKRYRLSVKGALLMTWKLCWPIKSVLSKADLSRSMKALEDA